MSHQKIPFNWGNLGIWFSVSRLFGDECERCDIWKNWKWFIGQPGVGKFWIEATLGECKWRKLKLRAVQWQDFSYCFASQIFHILVIHWRNLCRIFAKYSRYIYFCTHFTNSCLSTKNVVEIFLVSASDLCSLGIFTFVENLWIYFKYWGFILIFRLVQP